MNYDERSNIEANKRERSPSLNQIVAGIIIVAIAAVPLKMIFNTYQHASERARQSACNYNMMQLNIAMRQYTADNDGYFPASFHGAPQGWAGAIFPYAKSVELFHCPDEARGIGLAYTESYGLNSNFGTPAHGKSYYSRSLRESDVDQNTIQFFEVAGEKVDLTHPDEGLNSANGMTPTGYLSASGDGTGPCPQWGHLGTGCGSLAYATSTTLGRNIGHPRHSGGSEYMTVGGWSDTIFPTSVGPSANKSVCNEDNQPAIEGCANGTHAAGAGVEKYKTTFSTR